MPEEGTEFQLPLGHPLSWMVIPWHQLAEHKLNYGHKLRIELTFAGPGPTFVEKTIPIKSRTSSMWMESRCQLQQLRFALCTISDLQF